jgi:glyoxylase-like metal-dependent hydrolase (beta-lactamase superfamily II)
MMSDHFLPTNNVVLGPERPGDQHRRQARAVRDRHELGETHDAMGQLAANLKKVRNRSQRHRRVIPTHAHIDHVGGIMAADGSRNFPNAQIHIAQSDFEFWTDDKRLGTPAEGSALAAKKNLLPNRDRIVFYKDGQDVLPACRRCSRRDIRSDTPAS